jgi:4-hydroxy-4-methyl-2-oxoglutarate aldolase
MGSLGEPDDARLFDEMRRDLYAAVLSDVLDSLGYRDQAMDATIRPVYPNAVVVGRAHTVLSTDVYTMPKDPYSMEIAAVDSLKPNDVLIAATNHSTRTCFWGELLSTAARARGARGAIVDGHIRDVRRIEAMDFPVFATGMRPIDSAGRGLVVAYGEPVVCGGVLVQPGDVVFGDVDGIVVIPSAVADEAIARAHRKVSAENQARDDLARGDLLRTVYDRYGVL